MIVLQEIKMKAIAFDVDGTLVYETSSWLTVHRYFNTLEQAGENLKQYNNKIIDYQTFMKKDIELWGHSVHIDTIQSILSKFTLHPKANKIVVELKNKGYEIILVSAGLDVLVERVANELQIEYFVSNGLETHNDGYLTGNGIFRVDLIRKDTALSQMLQRINVEPRNCISVGDSKYDVDFLKHSGIGIAVGNDKELIKYAHYAINDLSEILDLID